MKRFLIFSSGSHPASQHKAGLQSKHRNIEFWSSAGEAAACKFYLGVKAVVAFKVARGVNSHSGCQGFLCESPLLRQIVGVFYLSVRAFVVSLL